MVVGEEVHQLHLYGICLIVNDGPYFYYIDERDMSPR